MNENENNTADLNQNSDDIQSNEATQNAEAPKEQVTQEMPNQNQGQQYYGGFPNYYPNFGANNPNAAYGPNFNYGNFYGYNPNPYNFNQANYGAPNNQFQGQFVPPEAQFVNQENNTQDNNTQENDTQEDNTNKDEQEVQPKDKKRSFSPWITILISVCSSILCVSILFALAAFFPSKDKSLLSSLYDEPESTLSGKTDNPSGTDVTLENETIEKGDNVTINIEGKSDIAQAVYAKAVNSVVGISVSQITGNKWDKTETIVSMGSGVVYSSDGIIITNQHVIEAAIDPNTKKMSSNFSIQIYFDNDLTEWTYVTEIIGYDAENDIAVLRADAKNLKPIEFADSDTLVTGETAISLGSPGGLSYMNSISEGILSGLNRTINTGTSVIYDLIQTTAAINPGNSGGALLNSEGQLIGICVIKIASTNYESMGFAINSNTVKTIVESILEFGYYNKPLFGVTINTMYTTAIAKEQGWEPGAYVESVGANSAAEKAGLKSGDVITKIGDTQITSFAELRRYLLDCKPGDTVSVTLYNTDTNETRTVSVTLSGTK